MDESLKFFNTIVGDKLIKPLGQVNQIEMDLNKLCSINLNKLKIGFFNCGHKFENIIKYLKKYNNSFFPDIICLVDIEPGNFNMYKKQNMNNSIIFNDIINSQEISYACYLTYNGDHEERMILINQHSINKAYNFNKCFNYENEIIINNGKLKFIHGHNPNDNTFENPEKDIKEKCLNRLYKAIGDSDIAFGDFNQNLLLLDKQDSIEAKYVKEFKNEIEKRYTFKRITNDNRHNFKDKFENFTFISRDFNNEDAEHNYNKDKNNKFITKELDYIITNNKLNISDIFFDGTGINVGSDHVYFEFIIDLN